MDHLEAVSVTHSAYLCLHMVTIRTTSLPPQKSSPSARWVSSSSALEVPSGAGRTLCGDITRYEFGNRYGLVHQFCFGNFMDTSCTVAALNK
jgi:curli biogenesis system outer membrane secretion channel CsgG